MRKNQKFFPLEYKRGMATLDQNKIRQYNDMLQKVSNCPFWVFGSEQDKAASIGNITHDYSNAISKRYPAALDAVLEKLQSYMLTCQAQSSAGRAAVSAVASGGKTA